MRFCRWFCASCVLAVAVYPAAGQQTFHIDTAGCTAPGTGTESDPFCAIQSGLDAAAGGDVIRVRPGTYTENISIDTKGVSLVSTDGPIATIIESATPGVHVVYILNSPPPYVLIDGFTITGGDVTDSANPLGGGMIMIHTQGEFRNCIFRGNRALRGGGFLNFGSYPVFSNCIFFNNEAAEVGGGVHNDHGFVTMINCAVVGNTAATDGGGMWIFSNPLIHNTIFWNNSDGGGADESAQIYIAPQSMPVIAHSCIQGLSKLAGSGNIGLDPLFVDAQSVDLRLSPGSPCIDAGDNGAVLVATDLDAEARFVDDPATLDTGVGAPPIVDLGPFEFGDDCNGNAIPDDVDIAQGTSDDCNANAIPDECEPDCNDNGSADDCDIATGDSEDCSGNGVPDECEPDCNGNAEADSCDMQSGSSDDCNGNANPDECDIASGASGDVDGNGTPDECESAVLTEAGARYFHLMPPAATQPYALHVTSDEWPCLAEYVDQNGSVVPSPVYLPHTTWHQSDLYVSGLQIIPATTYQVRLEFEGGQLSPPGSVTTWPWGDVDDSGFTSLLDVTLIVQGFQGNFSRTTPQAADLDGCTPNGVINIADALSAVLGFQGVAYDATCPLPCTVP